VNSPGINLQYIDIEYVTILQWQKWARNCQTQENYQAVGKNYEDRFKAPGCMLGAFL
jgi:hypothetical protein